jgi:hypothetical protein
MRGNTQNMPGLQIAQDILVGSPSSDPDTPPNTQLQLQLQPLTIQLFRAGLQNSPVGRRRGPAADGSQAGILMLCASVQRNDLRFNRLRKKSPLALCLGFSGDRTLVLINAPP